MKTIKIFAAAILLTAISCQKKDGQVNNESTQVTGEKANRELQYLVNGKSYRSYISYKSGAKNLPVVMVIPEWWGLNDYAKKRAEQLADLGYFAMAVDFYGDGKTAYNPDDAQKLSEPFYSDAALAKSVFDAAKDQIKNRAEADASQVAVIGYCFGGAMALNMARQEADLKGAVSFHGNLETGVRPNNNSVKILVANGASDSFVPAAEIEKFKKEMDSAKIDYKFVNYPNAVHAFTNPNATEMGKKFKMNIAYNAEADQKSWQEMKAFLGEIFAKK